MILNFDQDYIGGFAWTALTSPLAVTIDEPGCLHTADAARWNVAGLDAALTGLLTNDAARWQIVGSDMTC